MDLKFYSRNKQGRSLWFRTTVLFIFSGILCFGNAAAQNPGTALDFDNSLFNKVVVPSAPALNITNAITIEAWIYIKSTGGLSTQDVICKSSGSVNNSYIFPRTEDRWNTMQFRLKLNGHSDWSILSVPFKSAPTSIPTNTWHHVAASYDGGTMRIYIDGVLKGSLADQGTITVNNNPLVFGGQTDFTNEYFQGRLDEVRIWNRALSQCEISNNKNCELTGSESGLNAYYKFNNGFFNLSNLGILSLPDATSNHNDGTLSATFLLTGMTSNWSMNPQVNGNCTVFVPINATASAAASTIAVGDALQLTASGGTSYSWTGPNGFTSTQQNPTITNAQLANSGTYTVVVTQNGCSATAAVTVTVAMRAKALLFDGNNDMIRVPDNASMNSNTFTLETWIKPQSSTPAVQNVLSKMRLVRLNPDQGYIFPRTDDGWLNFSIWLAVNGQGVTISAPLTGGLNTWAHVAATYDGFNVKLYLNGNLVQTQPLQGFTAANTDLTMGVQDGGYIEYYKGGLDEVRIWRRALTQCEIQNNLTCELNGANNALANQNGLGAYFRFNQGLINVDNTSTTTLADSSGNGNNGVLSNFDLSGTASNWAAGGAVNNATCSVFQLQTVTANSNGPIVEVGNTVQLFASGGTNWSWTGPNGFTSNLQNPTIPNAAVNNSGTYTVSVQGNGCTMEANTKLSVAYKAYSLNMDGVNDEIKVPASPSLNISKAITLEAWIYPTSSAKPIQDVMSKSTADVNNGYIFPRTDNGWNSYVFYLHINGAWQKLSAPYPGLNQWHHVAATYDGYYMRIYLDGLLSASKEVFGTITQNTNDLILGQQPGFEEHYSGSVDDARIWNRALNQCEIMNNLYCDLHPLQRDGLVAFYKFNQGYDNVDNSAFATLADSSVNGNNGVLKNFALQGTGSNWTASFSSNRANTVCPYNELPNVTAFANGSLFSPGSTIKLFATGGVEYHWDGPLSFHADMRNPTITNATPAMTGTYTVTAPFVNCVVTASTRVAVNSTPAISASGALTFCPSGSVTLSSNNVGTAYQWYRNDIAIGGATSNAYVATQTGVYTLSVISAVDVLVSEPITVTVADNAAPVPSLPNLPTLNLATPATITGVPTAVDDCAGTIPGTTTDPLSYLYEGNYTITWKYDDKNGHVVTQTQQVVVTLGIDYRPPTLTVPSNINLTGDASICGAVANFAATATDNSPDPVTIRYSQNPGTVFPVGVTVVQVTATDATGNVSSGSFTVTVSPTVVAPISGNTTICATANTTLSTTSTGGSWSSNNTNIATVDQNGVVTGVNAGTAKITYTNACGASASIDVTVNVMPARPVVTVRNDCGSSLLSITNASGTILWSTNETAASITVRNAGTYTVTQTIGNCTSLPGSAIAAPLAIPAAPSVTVVNDCGSATLTANGVTGSLLWSNDKTSNSITVAQAGNYSVTQTSVDGCTSLPGSATAAPKAVPAAPTVTVVNICGSSTLTANDFTGTLRWSNNATTPSITVTQGGDYTVTQTVDGCTSNAGTGTAVPGTQPLAPVVRVTNDCGSSTLSVIGAVGTVRWSNGATGSSITVTQAGEYNVTQTVSGCTSDASLAVASPNMIPAAPTGNNASRCGAGNVTLSATAGANETIDWYAAANGGSALATGNNFVATIVSGNVTYYAETRNLTTGCVSATRTAVTAVYNALPAAITYSTIQNCGSTTVIANNVTGSIVWSPNGETGNSIVVYASGVYSAVQTANGCSSPIAPINVTVKAVPTAPAVTVADNCGSSTITASPSFGGQLKWSTGPADLGRTSITVTTPGSYQVVEVLNNCAGTPTTFSAAPNALPAAPIGSNASRCGAGDVTLSATAGANETIDWYASPAGGTALATGTNNFVATLVSGNAVYYAETRNLTTNCVSANRTAVTAGFKAVPPAVTYTTTQNCGSTTVTANNVIGQLLWNPGNETSNTIVVITPGVYSATQTLNGCTSPVSSINVTVNAVPTAPAVTVADNCGSSTITAVASFGGQLQWSTGAADNGRTSITVTTAGNYKVWEVLNGCAGAVKTVAVAPKAIPAAPIAGNASRCGAGDVTLSATAGANETIDWYASASNGTALVAGNNNFVATLVSGNATYYAETRNLVTGCVSATRTAVTATFKAVPATPIVTVADSCGKSVLSISNVAGAILWSNGATTPSITVTSAGGYTVTQTANNCTSAVASGNANPLVIPATPVITVVNNCGNSVLSTNATGALVWSNGATGSPITVYNNNNYSVTSTVGTCASTSAPVTVTINTAPVVAPIVGASSVAVGANTQFSSTTSGGVWSSSNPAVASVSSTGLVTGVGVGNTTINYKVTSAAGCSTTVSAPIGVVSGCTAPVVTASNIIANTLATATGCNSPVTYSVTTTGTNPITFSYTLTGATTGSGTGTGSGAVFNVGVTTVKVTATNACGSSSASFTVTLKDGTAPVPVVSSLPTITGQCSVNLGATASSNNNGSCGDDCNCCRSVCHCRTSSCSCRSYDYRSIVTYFLSILYNYYYGDDDHGCDHDGDDNSTATNTNAPKATDNCKGTIVGTTTDPLSYSSQGTYTIHWKYDDGNGNITIQEQTVIVKDDTKPTINVPANINLSCGASTTPSACGGSATGSDNCGGVTISYTDAPNAAGTQILRTWKATDAAGNFSTGVQTITITDNTKPVISDVADVTLSCVGSTDPSVTGRPTATDCSAVTLTYTDATSGKYITRTWKATDAFGNYSTSTQKITIADNTKPVISDVPDVTVSCNGSTDPSATGRPTASDCSGVTLTYTDATSGNVITRTWKATDGAGNYSTSTQKITMGASFAVDITSVPTSTVYTGGIATNLYLGYGAQSTTLQTCALPSAGAPYTYSWSGSATSRLNSTSSAAPVFSPSSAGSATFYVTVTNRYGCTSTDVITICVTDIRVPNSGGNKVYVCHQTNSKTNPTQTIEVSINAVPAHLGDGGSKKGCGNKDEDDRLGSCDQAPCGTTAINSAVSAGTQTQTVVTQEGTVPVTNQKSAAVTTEETIKVTVLPNPSTTYFTLKLESKSNLPMNLRVMDANGRMVDARSAIVPNSSLQIGHNYSSGTYYAEVIQGGQRKVVQLIKSRG